MPGRLLLLAPLALFPMLATACEDPFDFDWIPQIDTVTVYSLARPDYIDRPGAYDFGPGGGPRVVEAPASSPIRWDLAFSEEGGEFVALPAALFRGFDIEPGVQEITDGSTFDDLHTAPRDGYITGEPVPLREGGLYVVRSRRDSRRCNYYGKFEVLELDPAGTVMFQSVENYLCNDRELIPPDDRD